MLPTHKLVFTKLLLIQGFIGVLTLLFCPQFNLSLTSNFDLFHYFHRTFGDKICMLICGGIFIGTGALFAGTIMTRYELSLVRKNSYLYYFALIGILLSVFFMFGAQFYLGALAFWLVGAYGTSVVSLEIINLLKIRTEQS
jgi:hypothetical protein